MKTYILQLERHDDVISTRDKMGWSKSARILLVWPRRGKILRRRVDLVLLQRRGAELGAQLALVTRDRAVITSATEVGIPVFASTKAAETQPWRRTRPRRPVLKLFNRVPADAVALRQQHTDFHRLPTGVAEHPLVRFLVFLIGLAAVVGLAFFFYPSASVRFTPARQQQVLEMAVWASPEIRAVSASGGLPAQILHVIVEGQETAQATGTMTVADTYAQGTVQLSNLTQQEVEVPAGTVFRTLVEPPVRFETITAVTLAAGAGQTAQAAVRAVLPGSASNCAEDEVKAVEGEAGLRIAVNNREAIVGGTDRAGRVPSPADEARLRENLLSSLEQTALNEFDRLKMSGREIVPASISVRQILQETREPPEGQPADRLQLTLRVEFSAWAVQTRDLEAVALTGMLANMPKGFVATPGSLRIEQVTPPRLGEDNQARWQIRARQSLQAAWTTEQVVSLVSGKSPRQAVTDLQSSVAMSAGPEIELSPRWWVRMPYLHFRIEVATP